MDFKHIPEYSSNYKFILVLLCEVSNFMIVEYTKTIKAPEVCNVLFKTFIRYFGSPTCIVNRSGSCLYVKSVSIFLQSFWNETSHS